MGKIIFNSEQTTEKQKKFLAGRKQTIVNVKKDCKNLGYTDKELQKLEEDFLWII